MFVEAVLFLLGVETWKWTKRVWFRRTRRAQSGKVGDEGEKIFESYLGGEREGV